MELLSAAGVAGLISLGKAIIELATGTKKNREDIKSLKEETSQNAKDIEKVAAEVQRLRDRIDQNERESEKDRRAFIDAIKLALIESGADYKKVAEIETRFGKKKEQ